MNAKMGEPYARVFIAKAVEIGIAKVATPYIESRIIKPTENRTIPLPFSLDFVQISVVRKALA